MINITLKLYEALEDSPPNAKVVGLNPTAFNGGFGPSPTAVAGAGGGSDETPAFRRIVAHEVGHTIGLTHPFADPGAGAALGSGCSAAGGPLQGVGIDALEGSGPGPGTFALIGAEKPGVFDAEPDAPAAYDYMSKACSAWVSAPYWARTVRKLRPGGRLSVGWTDYDPGSLPFLGGAADPTVRSAATSRRLPRRAKRDQEPVVRVSAVLGVDGRATITRVQPDRGAPDPPAPGSDVAVVVRDRSGAEISRIPVRAQAVDEPGLLVSRPLNAVVPGRRAARVEIVDGGTVVASREASPNAPRAKLRRPRKGARIGAKGRFTVRRRMSDADSDPLETKVQFSSDRGRSWRTLDLDVRGKRARIPGSLLPRTRKGMLRVVVSDGFNVARSVVRRIRAAGGRPQVEITGLARKRTTVLADTVVVLERQAATRREDDQGEDARQAPGDLQGEAEAEGGAQDDSPEARGQAPVARARTAIRVRAGYVETYVCSTMRARARAPSLGA